MNRGKNGPPWLGLTLTADNHSHSEKMSKHVCKCRLQNEKQNKKESVHWSQPQASRPAMSTTPAWHISSLWCFWWSPQTLWILPLVVGREWFSQKDATNRPHNIKQFSTPPTRPVREHLCFCTNTHEHCRGFFFLSCVARQQTGCKYMRCIMWCV